MNTWSINKFLRPPVLSHDNTRQCRGAAEPSLEAKVLLERVFFQVTISATPQQMPREFGLILRLMLHPLITSLLLYIGRFEFIGIWTLHHESVLNQQVQPGKSCASSTPFTSKLESAPWTSAATGFQWQIIFCSQNGQNWVCMVQLAAHKLSHGLPLWEHLLPKLPLHSQEKHELNIAVWTAGG